MVNAKLTHLVKLSWRRQLLPVAVITRGAGGRSAVLVLADGRRNRTLKAAETCDSLPDGCASACPKCRRSRTQDRRGNLLALSFSQSPQSFLALHQFPVAKPKRRFALPDRETEAMAGARCLPLAGSAAAAELLASVDTLLFDCDGVIWRGEQAVPGAPEVLAALRRSGKRVFFLTNNSTKTRSMYAAKLSRLGLGADESEVFGTAYCTALYLRKVARLRGKAYVIGGQALSQELQAAGVAHLGPGPDPVQGGMSDWAAAPLDAEVRAVVVGFDEHFSYMKLTKALAYLRDPRCLFLATNTDTRLPLEGGAAIPGTGCLVRAVETAAHRQAQIIGKPSQFLYECVASENDVDPARTVMVGDRLDTDILMGFNCGLKTILTLTGFSSLEEAKSYQGCPAKRSMVPDYYVDSIADLLSALQA